MVPMPSSESHSWAQLDAVTHQVPDAGMPSTEMVVVQPVESTETVVVQPVAVESSEQLVWIQPGPTGQEQETWLQSSGVAWFQTAESGAGGAFYGCQGNPVAISHSHEMAWLHPEVLIWEQGPASGREGMQRDPSFPSWEQPWQANTEAEGACSFSEPHVQQDLSLLSEEEDEEGSEDDEFAGAAVSKVPRRRRRQHRAGRRRRRAAVRRAERQQRSPPVLALMELRGHEEASADLPPEFQQDLLELAACCSEQLESGVEEEQCAAIAALHGMVLALSFEPQGCRVVQRAFEVASRSDTEALCLELHGHVRVAVESPHANHVVQKVVEVMPSAKTTFVPKELLGVAVYAASHRFGCRIFCRLIEHSGTAESRALIDEILDHVDEVCRSGYGHHVMCHLMEHGSSQQKKRIVTALLSGGPLQYARHRHASYVLEQVLTFADRDDQDLVATELLRSPENVPMMAMSQCGCHVVRALITNCGGLSQMAIAHLQNAAARLEGSRFGRRLLEEFKLRPCGEPVPHRCQAP
mmetsp:Transcript_70540/g.130017  ORF Transcript_70540/g.130017 Transcript_70540/m.130017 type:complete len:525 (+) Transcript_70540:66-1640(+)